MLDCIPTCIAIPIKFRHRSIGRLDYSLSLPLHIFSAPVQAAIAEHDMAQQHVTEVLTFPTDPSEFDQDHRISFSRLDNKYIAVQESDGTEFEFDAQLKRWIPSADEDEEALIQMQQSAYSAPDPRAGNGKRRREDDLEVSCARWSRRTIPPHEPASVTSFATVFDGCDGHEAMDVCREEEHGLQRG